MEPTPIACTLDAQAATAQADEWARLRERAGLRVEPIAGGARLWLGLEARAEVEDLVRREAQCCAFLDLDVATDENRLRVDITSATGEAGPIIAALAGLECC